MNKIRILYIEDNDSQRRELAKLLRSRKFTVRPAASGKSGIAILKKSKFDVIISDLNMPDMDGLTVLKRSRKIAPDIPLILITAHGSIPNAVKAIRMGAFHFISKPVEINELISVVNQAIESHATQKRLLQSELRLKMITDTVPDIIYSLDPRGIVLTINPAARLSLGHAPKDIIGKSVFDMIHPDDREMVIRELNETIRKKDTRTRTLELRLVSKSGEYRDFEISRRLIFENGKMVRNDGIARDVTERKLLEQQLKEYSRTLEKKVEERTFRLEYSARQLEALNKLSSRLTRIHDEDRLMDKIPEFLSKTLDFDRVMFLLKAKSGFKLRSYHFKKDSSKTKRSFLKWADSKKAKFPFRFYESIRSNKTIYMPDLSSDSRWPHEPGKSNKARAAIITPIRSGGKAIGLTIGSLQDHDREIDKQDIARFETFANMVGFSLDSIRAYQSLENKVAERTASLNDANRLLKEKAKQLEFSTIELGKANIDLLAAQEQLQEKNDEMQSLLDRLSNRRDELQAILNSSENAVIMVNKKGEVAASNSRVQDYFNISVDDVIGRDIESVQAGIYKLFLNPVKIKEYSEKLLSSPNIDGSETVDPHLLYEHSFTTKDDKPRCITVFSGPVRDKSGSEIGRLWIYTDVTKMKDADELLHRVVNASPVPLIITRIHDGRILFANDRLGELVGTTARDLVGKRSPDFYFDQEDRNKVIKLLGREGYVRDHEVRLKRLDGSVFWALLSLVGAEIDGENAVIGGIMDINQRREMEDALRWERNFVSAVLDTAGALVVVLDSNGNVRQFNKACQETTGYTFEEVSGKPFWEFFILPEEFEGVKGVFDNIKAGQFPNTHENYWLTKDGRKRLISWSNTALSDNNGEVEFVIATGIDISERKIAEEALRISEERFRNLVENANDIIYSLTPEGIFSYVSPNWKKILGHEVAEVESKSFVLFVHPDDLPACQEFFKGVMEQGNSLSGIEYRVMHKDGNWRWHTSNASPLRDERGDISAFIGVAHDITESRKILDDLARANRELKDTQTQLVQSEKMASLGMLVAGIAHEINTPVGAVSSMHDTLMRSVTKLKDAVRNECSVNAETYGRLQSLFKTIEDANSVIDSGTSRVNNIVKRLRSFARLDEAELKEIDLHEGIEDTLTLMHHEIKHKAEIVKNYGDIPKISCYPGRMNQVYLNLLVNAVQAIKEKGIITISTRRINNKISIEFEDNGEGIARKNLSKIFDPGFTTKGVGIGTGLGLSICYRIIQDHRGDIRVESEPGKGSRFIITLPLNLKAIIGDRANSGGAIGEK